MQIIVKKGLEAMRRSQEKLENSFAKIKAELKVMNNTMNNTEKRIVIWKTEQWKLVNQSKRQKII